MVHGPMFMASLGPYGSNRAVVHGGPSEQKESGALHRSAGGPKSQRCLCSLVSVGAVVQVVSFYGCILWLQNGYDIGKYDDCR